MDVKIFRINYKSDFILTLNSDAGWMTPFCIKFWTGAPSQAYFVGWDGDTYTHCAYDPTEPTKLLVQFDDHHLPIGDLKFQIGYHFTVADFPTSVEDEVINQADVIIEQDGEPAQVMLDFNGETAPEIEFSLPAYANEAQRIANEQERIAAEEQRVSNEQQRISNEEDRISAEESRQEHEQQRIRNEETRIEEFAGLKADAIAATGAANDAATLANEKAALAQQKADYAQAKGDYAKAQGDTALADHERAESDHATAASDHTQASSDHDRAESDHSQAAQDHDRAESDHTRAESDHAAVEVYVDSLGAFDISSYHATGSVLAKYADLTAALGTNGANIPDVLRKGGMSVKFVQSSDNKYVQYRYMSSSTAIADFTNVVNWQGVEDVPVAGSDNLVKSSGVFNKTNSIEANIAAITGNTGDIPFVVGTVEGMRFGDQLVYLELDTRLRVEMDSNKIHTIEAKNGYEFAICAFEDKIPTAKRQRLHSESVVTFIDVQTSISSITAFNPNKIVLSIKNTEGTIMTDIKSLDEVLNVTFVETTINDLSNNLSFVENIVNKDTKAVYIVGSHSYTTNSITFDQGSILAIKKVQQSSPVTITFDTETTYTLDVTNRSLIFNGETVAVAKNADVKETDVLLLIWSNKFVGGKLYDDYQDYTTNFNKLTDIPFRLGSFKGVSSNYIEYYDLASRISVELDTQNIDTIKTKSGYAITAACLFEDSIPTSDFASITVNNDTVYIKKAIKQEYTFIPNKVILSIKKSNNTGFDIGLSSVEDIIDICFASIPADKKITAQKSVIKCEVVRGALYGTGYYPTTLGIVNGYAHTPLFINIKDSMCTIKNTEILSGYIFYYDKNKDYVKKIDINTLVGGVVPRYVNTEYIRFSFNTRTNNSVLPYNGIYLEGTWDGINRVEEYSNIPSDSGYTNIVFPVRINTNVTPSTSVSSITEQYTYSENCGVLHLPASYTSTGKGVPLIIYLHGAQDRYTPADKRLKVRFAQEWDAAGYAQMDVDMIPSLYNFTQSGYAGTGDDLVCVEAAYNWAIKHYNIRRDGIYLFGRSRGGMAVLSILGKYNPVKLPIVCALSNAGANSMLLYALFRDSVTTNWWNAFCASTGLLNPPTIATNTPIVAQPTVASFLRDNIDKWWYKAMVALPMIVDNPTVYQTPEQIFDLLVSSYSDTDKGKTFSENFVEQCKFRSPVPLRFDWCVGDTAQRWDIPWFYGLAGKNAFVNSKLVGNSVYREWPECTGGEPHYHEDYNIYNGDYTLPNGAVVTNPSMAQVEWLLWAQSHDNRDL